MSRARDRIAHKPSRCRPAVGGNDTATSTPISSRFVSGVDCERLARPLRVGAGADAQSGLREDVVCAAGPSPQSSWVLIPSPRHRPMRFHGVLAPHASWRRAVVPERPEPAPSSAPLGAPGRTCTSSPCVGPLTSARAALDGLGAPAGGRGAAPAAPSHGGHREGGHRSPGDRPGLAGARAGARHARRRRRPRRSTTRRQRYRSTTPLPGAYPVGRAAQGASTKRMSSTCGRCGGRMAVLAFITERDVVREILDHPGRARGQALGLPSTGPPAHAAALARAARRVGRRPRARRSSSRLIAAPRTGRARGIRSGSQCTRSRR